MKPDRPRLYRNRSPGRDEEREDLPRGQAVYPSAETPPTGSLSPFALVSGPLEASFILCYPEKRTFIFSGTTLIIDTCEPEKSSRDAILHAPGARRPSVSLGKRRVVRKLSGSGRAGFKWASSESGPRRRLPIRRRAPSSGATASRTVGVEVRSLRLHRSTFRSVSSPAAPRLCSD
ncbi:hypothetical protein EYF80_034673 [Liparis tanakae]|uniref:Uncharacterized protein n=1 Tax=Liparis tanakae TaxID=230148 RepID=A0A4Z2GP08_9TELE|nr:hypothetical protein EYF80_034673 [Liparis tanakae]